MYHAIDEKLQKQFERLKPTFELTVQFGCSLAQELKHFGLVQSGSQLLNF